MDHRPDMSQLDNSISLPVAVIQQAFERAQHLGVDLSGYILSLIAKDLAEPGHRSWLEPLPESVTQQYGRDVHEFMTFELESPQPSATSGEGLADLLDKEIENLADG